MTTHAKLGLLLGLLFIIAIAFVINGLPQGDSQTRVAANPDTNKNPYTILDRTNTSLGETTQDACNLTGGYRRQVDVPAGQVRDEVRFNGNHVPRPLPAPRPAPAQNAQGGSAIAGNFEPVAQPGFDRAAAQGLVNQANGLSASNWLVYKVKSGDSLTKIVKKFYSVSGTGELYEKIDEVWRANKAVLPSKDSVREGQKLVMPGICPSASAPSANSPAISRSSAASSPAARTYKVVANDSLWSIAHKKLGNGSRIDDIIKLNPELKPDGSNLLKGMKIKLPRQ